jgi:hypothetical protein
VTVAGPLRTVLQSSLTLALGALTGCSDAPPLYDAAKLAESGHVAGRGGDAGVGGAAGSTGGMSGSATAGGTGGTGSGATCARSTPVLVEDGIKNARDLGGIPLEGGRTVACGKLFRGPPLELPGGCSNYDALGIKVVVDLRQASERGNRPDAACTTENARVIAAPLPIPYQVSPANYIADFNTLDSMALIFHALGTADGYPMYFHCTYGRDRTAIVAAVILSALGASRDAIMIDYELTRPHHGAFPESLEATLDELERRGGVEGYYAELGVTAEELAFLREYATAD